MSTTPLHTIEEIVEGKRPGNKVSRMRVEGGWLYTTNSRVISRAGAYALAISTTYVPDSKGTKEVIATHCKSCGGTGADNVSGFAGACDVCYGTGADEDLYSAGRGNFKGVIFRGHKTGNYYYMNDDDTWSEGFDTYKECGKAYSALR